MHHSLIKNHLVMTSGSFRFGPGAPRITINGGKEKKLHLTHAIGNQQGRLLTWTGQGIELTQRISQVSQCLMRMDSTLRNTSRRTLVLNRVVLFACTRPSLGRQSADTRIFEQSAYQARVRTPRQMATCSDQQTSLEGTRGSFASQSVAVFFDPVARRAMLIGFERLTPWMPTIIGRMFVEKGRIGNGGENVDAGSSPKSSTPDLVMKLIPDFRQCEMGFDGSDLEVGPGASLSLGDLVWAEGEDPLALLDEHGERVKSVNDFADPPAAFANWCSWYPFRLQISEQLMLATAKVAVARNLPELGLRFIQADLGWQAGDLPTSFEPNQRFPHGLRWLSKGLRTHGLELGLWTGALCVAHDHHIVKQHPEWLIPGPDGKPQVVYKWFWAPFCPVYGLDVTHPEAQEWLRQEFTTLAKAGVRYVKWDFAGVVTNSTSRNRYDHTMAGPGARETVRQAFRIGQDALDSQGVKGFLMDCGATDNAGAGIAGLAYVNYDTGNTGIGWRHLRTVYTSFAGHLFKHKWALLQPSCLVMGLPGTLDEARVRATATFMGAGHVDIGDDLMTLPEERWQVLLSVLPPNTTPARVIDLFDPIMIRKTRYGKAAAEPQKPLDSAGACVWVLPVETDWDSWTLVALFNWGESENAEGPEFSLSRSAYSLTRRFCLPLERIGYAKTAQLWGHEFWSGQFLGDLPVAERPDDAYRHIGDEARLVLESPDGQLDVGFSGPGVKLLILRKKRNHPWPVGTSFHQSGGRELTQVRWDEKTRTLHGVLLRPPGEQGYIHIAGCPEGGHRRHPIRSTSDATLWEVRFP